MGAVETIDDDFYPLYREGHGESFRDKKLVGGASWQQQPPQKISSNPYMNQPKGSWEERFDATFDLDNYGNSHAMQNKVKDFIRAEKEKSYQEGREEIRKEVLQALPPERIIHAKKDMTPCPHTLIHTERLFSKRPPEEDAENWNPEFVIQRICADCGNFLGAVKVKYPE